MQYNEFISNIKDKKVRIGIVGMGYVGLPLALLFAKKGFEVTGFTRTVEKAKLLQKGEHSLSDNGITKDLQSAIKDKRFTAKETNTKDLQDQDVIIICVPTPVNERKQPDLTDLINVASELGKVNLTGKLIINESTVAPFTTRSVFYNIGKEFYLATSPERVDPGNEKHTTENISKVVGAINKKSLILAKTLYKQILKAKVVAVDNLEEAEMAKILENTYRAVNIALINDFAKLAEKCNIDILNVIKAAKTKWSFHAHYPSIGVGGHCIPVDPYYLIELAQKKGLDMNLVRDGLLVNEEMPEFVAEKVLSNYVKGMKILVYGLTYKKNINDLRESPVVTFCKSLKNKKIPFTVYDPYIKSENIKKMGLTPGSLQEVDILVVGTDHDEFKEDNILLIGRNTIVIDGRNYFKDKKGKLLLGIGRARK